MKREAGGPCLSAVFVDYDNIYLSLKRKSEEAAKRFAKDASSWLREIELGRLITATNAPLIENKRRIVMNRCYGNPVPRRNSHDNSTDMNSFPFVRHHFLRAGFEVIDCPPLTAQLKNSSDIRMVMDVRDYLTHDTYFDEFIILSGDADFTPVLHRLRAHARRTIIFANDYTAAPYTAISDGEVRETDLIALILDGIPASEGAPMVATTSAKIEQAKREILSEVVAGVRASPGPVPLESLADRAVRALGHEKTIATAWAGAGSFSELLRRGLPAEISLSGEPPYMAYEPKRHQLAAAPIALEARDLPLESVAEAPTQDSPTLPPTAAAQRAAAAGGLADSGRSGLGARGSVPSHQASAIAANANSPGIQQSITRIQEACQAPPMAPQEYRLLFELMAKEINENDLIGAQTLANITQRAQERGLEIRRDDVRFILEVVSESDPWFEQGASANLFAGRFRNFVVARCRGQGLSLSADELDLIDAWFAGGTLPQSAPRNVPAAPTPPPAPSPAKATAKVAASRAGEQIIAAANATPSSNSRWWSGDEARPQVAEQRGVAAAPPQSEEFPRIVRTRLRG